MINPITPSDFDVVEPPGFDMFLPILPIPIVIITCTSSTRTRRGGSCLRFDYKTFFIYRTCCAAVQEQDLRATILQRNAKWTLSSHCTLALHSPHFISSQIIWAILTSCHLISALLISSHPFLHVIQVSSSQLFSSHPNTENSSSQLISALLHERKLLLLERNLLHKKHKAHKAFPHRSLRHRCIYIHGKSWQNTLYYKACAKNFPVLLCTTKLAQRTSQYYFVLQSLHRALSRTTLYYKACTKHFPVLLCTTKLAQSSSGKCSVQAL